MPVIEYRRISGESSRLVAYQNLVCAAAAVGQLFITPLRLCEAVEICEKNSGRTKF